MDRREALAKVALLLGGTVIGAGLFLENGCRPDPKKVSALFNQDDIDLLNEISDTILPDTAASPGAKAAKVGDFMAMMVEDCYSPEEQKIFIDGMSKLNMVCRQKYRKGFMDCDAGQRTAILITLDAERKAHSEKMMPGSAKKKGEDPNGYFRMMKELTLLGFFTSEIGATKALRYVAVPGKYIGVVPYKKGDRAWCSYDYFN